MITVLAIDPTDKADAIQALQLVEDLNESIANNQIKVELDDNGTPRLYPVN